MTQLFTQLLTSMRARLDEAIEELVPEGRPCALIDYPNHENVGDSAIWTGEQTLLRKHCRQVDFVADITSYSRRRLRRRIGSEGVILLHGGGNLGDLYHHHQSFRESIVGGFPRNRIVMMPQTATFRTQQALDRAKRTFGAHGDLTLLLRDSESLQFAADHLGAQSRLVPDSAVALHDMITAHPKPIPVIWLARTDHEGRVDRAGLVRNLAAEGSDVVLADWTGKRSAPVRLVAWRQATLVGGVLARLLDSRSSLLTEWLTSSYEGLAVRRVGFGERLLGSAEVIVTDRLHAHIFALLLGTPHVLLNDRYDKVGRFYRTWSAGQRGVKFASDQHDALKKARELLRHARESGT